MVFLRSGCLCYLEDSARLRKKRHGGFIAGGVLFGGVGLIMPYLEKRNKEASSNEHEKQIVGCQEAM